MGWILEFWKDVEDLILIRRLVKNNLQKEFNL